MPTLYDVLQAHKDNPKDKRVFGLVLQGGGMRAVYSAGAVIPLIEYGFTDAFEHVLGASAGAINGAYFIDAQPQAINVYINDVSNKNFVNLLRKEKKVDVDYLVDSVLQARYPLNEHRLNAAHAKLHVLVTNAKNGRKVVLDDHHKLARIYEEIRATAALPLLYDKPVRIDDTYYIDGAVADAIPVDIAVGLGCTDIVVIMTHQIGQYAFDSRHDRLVKRLIRRLAKDYPASIRKNLPTNERLLQANLRTIMHPLKNTRIYLLEPSLEHELIGLSTIDRQKVLALANLGIIDMDTFLHQELKQ